MTNNAELMYHTSPPPPNRARIILGDDSTKKVESIGKIDLIFHSKTKIPAMRYDANFVLGLGFNILFSFHVAQKQELV